MRLLRWVGSAVTTVAFFYLLAGRWDLPWLWTTTAVSSLITLALIWTIDPELARERRRPGPGGRDRISRVGLSVTVAAQVTLACLDVGRLHWSDTVPPWLHVLALALFTAGFGLLTWSVAVNRFFSSVVRIQEERGHRIITAGPYGYVRHPGYLGMLMGYPVISLAIGSWWALIPGLGAALVVWRRLAIEDSYLKAHWAGYAEYAARVPYRLVPGVW